jgi:predicted N-acetyltransferase YhbS
LSAVRRADRTGIDRAEARPDRLNQDRHSSGGPRGGKDAHTVTELLDLEAPTSAELEPTRPAERAKPTIRVARPIDYPAIREVLAASYRGYGELIPAQIFPVYLAELLDLAGRPLDARLLLAEVDGHVVGTATYYEQASAQGVDWPTGWGGLRAVAVRPDWEGRGVGRALMTYCEATARRAGAPAIGLHTGSFMTRAIDLYEHLGYQRAPRFDLDVTDHYGLRTDRQIRLLAYRLLLSEK